MSGTVRTCAVIPARYASSRFPGKPLAILRGRPLIEHVYRRASLCKALDRILVATDDERIRRRVEAFGGECVMTSRDHISGSDRLGEVAQGLDAEVIVNVQGDEPLIDPSVIEAVIAPMMVSRPPDIATAAVPLSSAGEYLSPDVVKVAMDAGGRALYFSRAPIPHGWSGPAGFRHIGIYAYQRQSLLRFVSLPEGNLERIEKLEQLRALENGMAINVVVVPGFVGIGVDRPEDLAKAERLMEQMEKGGQNTF